MNKELVDIIVKLVIAVCIVIVNTYLIPWIKAKAGAERMAEFYDFTEKCVQSAEKLFTREQCVEKKEYVLKLCTTRLEEMGIQISLEEVNAIVEGFVKAVKG